jgi:hypothetical protein
MKTVRITLMLAVAAGLAAAVFFHDEPAVMAVGLAPIAWLSLEGCWRLFDNRS